MDKFDLVDCVVYACIWPLVIIGYYAQKDDKAENLLMVLVGLGCLALVPVWVVGIPFAFLFFIAVGSPRHWPV